MHLHTHCPASAQDDNTPQTRVAELDLKSTQNLQSAGFPIIPAFNVKEARIPVLHRSSKPLQEPTNSHNCHNQSIMDEHDKFNEALHVSSIKINSVFFIKKA